VFEFSRRILKIDDKYILYLGFWEIKKILHGSKKDARYYFCGVQFCPPVFLHPINIFLKQRIPNRPYQLQAPGRPGYLLLTAI
jgi:hypothetical protein